jgi:UDP-N-acetyl-D-glucosamine dehydrogenase
VVPHFLAWLLREYGYTPRLIEVAHELNAQMPIYVVQKIADTLNDAGMPIRGSRVLLLGLAYKADVHDTRESPSLEVMRQLLSRGADVRYCDPWVDSVELEGDRHVSQEWSQRELVEADCVVLLTAHTAFLEHPLWEHARRIVDTRNVVPDGPTVTRL